VLAAFVDTTPAAVDPPEIRVGSELDFRPYAFTDKDGQATGFSTDLIKAVAQAMGLRVRITTGPWNRVWDGLVTGQFDVLPTVARVPGREQVVDFSLPHTETFDAFFVRPSQPAIRNLAAAAGKEIVVLRSDAAHHELVQRKFAGKLILVDSIPDGLRLVAGGRHDAFLCSKLVGVLELEEAGIQGIKPGPPIPDYKRVFSFAVRKGSAELLEKLNQGLLVIKANGEYNQIYRRWLGLEEPWQRWRHYLWVTLAIVGPLAVLAVALVVVLRRLVRQRTAELEQANRALRRSQELLNETQRLSKVGGWEFDVAARRVSWTEEVYRIHGVSADYDPSRPERDMQFYAPEDQQRLADAFRRAVAQGESYDLELQLVTAQGNRLWVRTRGQAEIEAGQVVHLTGNIMDITEVKQAQAALREANVRLEERVVERTAALRESEERSRLAVTATNLGTWDYNPVSGALVWDARCKELFGLPPEAEVNYDTFLAGLHPEDRERANQIVHRAFDPASGGLFDLEYRTAGLRDSGVLRWVRATGRASFNDDGQAIRFVGTVRDITERKQAEEEAGRSRKTLFELVERSPFGTYIVDSKFHIAMMNSASQAGAFRNVRPVIGRPFDEAMRILWPEAVAAEIIAHFRHTLDTGVPYFSRDFVNPRHDAEIVEAYEWELHRMTLPDGQHGVICYYYDSTKLREAEAAVRASEQRLRRFYESSLLGVIYWNMNGEITDANDKFLEMVGYNREDLRAGRIDWVNMTPPEHRHLDEASGQELKASGVNKVPFEKEYIRKDGSRFPVLVAGAMLDEARFNGVAFVLDITKRKRAEEELKASEERHRLLATTMLQGVVHQAADGMIVSINPAAERILGKGREQFLGSTSVREEHHTIREDGSPFPGLDHPAMVALRTGEPVRAVVMGVWNPQAQADRWISVDAVPVFRPGETRPAEVYTVFEDITERKRAEELARKRAEEALRMSEEEFRSLAEAMPQIVWATRPDGWNIYFNQQWVDYTGMTMEESYGHGWNTPFHPDDKQRAWEAWQRATQHNERYSLECRLRRADGVYRWWLVRGAPMRGVDGEILKWFGTCTDIEELKRAEVALQEANDLLEQRVAERTAALRESEERFRSLANAMPQLAWIARPDGHLFWYNQRWYEYTDTRPEQMEGWGWQSVHDPVELPKVLERWKASIATGEPFEMTFPLRGADGVFRMFLTRGYPLRDAAGRVTQWFGTNTDVTELKRAEAAVEASLREKVVLLKEIHHRVKNNLQVISSLVDLQTNTLDNPEMRGLFRDVRDRVRSMALVHEKLYQSESLSSVDFADYARSLLNYLARALGSSATAIDLKMDLQAVPLSVEVAVPCGLILHELASNAFKHAFRGRARGEVTTALGCGRDGRVFLRVSDDGVGLPTGMNWRQSPSLGLQLVHLLARQLNATVEVRTPAAVPGAVPVAGGTEFEIIFQAGKPETRP
jgi:PAS domain S-box-containing protein